MIGVITIRDLKIHATLGVYPDERTKLQEINLDISLKVDISKCIISDSLEDTVNYEIVYQLAYELFSQEHYFLIEKCAYELARRLFDQLPILDLKIEVKKKGALPLAHYASLTIEMTREEFLCLG